MTLNEPQCFLNLGHRDGVQAPGLKMAWMDVLRALHHVLGCEKTYVVQFAEAEGFAHVHFHIVPRAADLAPDLRGPRIFRLLSPDDRPHVGEQQRDELAAQLAGELGT